MMRFPKIVTGAAAGAALFMLGTMAGHAQTSPHGTTAPSAETSRQIELLGKILDTVRSNYVDKPDDGKLLDSAINGIIGSLDPHTAVIYYIPLEDHLEILLQTPAGIARRTLDRDAALHLPRRRRRIQSRRRLGYR